MDEMTDLRREMVRLGRRGGSRVKVSGVIKEHLLMAVVCTPVKEVCEAREQNHPG